MRKMTFALLMALSLAFLCSTALAVSMAPDIQIPANIYESMPIDWFRACTEQLKQDMVWDGNTLSFVDRGYSGHYVDIVAEEIDDWEGRVVHTAWGTAKDGVITIDGSGFPEGWAGVTLTVPIFDDDGVGYVFSWNMSEWYRMVETHVKFAPAMPYTSLLLPDEADRGEGVILSWPSGRAQYWPETGMLYFYSYTAKDFNWFGFEYDAETATHACVDFTLFDVGYDPVAYPPLTAY